MPKSRKHVKPSSSFVRMLAFAFIGVVLILDWTALTDITTRNQPSYVLQYITLAASMPVLVVGYVFFTKFS